MSFQNKWGFPDLGFGLGLRTAHYSYILEHSPKVDFFEIIAENYMASEGRPAYVLDRIAEQYPVIVHGVSMSVGSTDPVDFEYLGLLKRLARRVKAEWVSDHLCWTGVLGRNTHDLLPLPLTEESLRHVVSRVKTMQDFLEMPIVLENPSTYLEFSDNQMAEWEFLNQMSQQADCGLLLDVNNVYVSSFNHGFSALEYIDKIDGGRVVYHHLSGHSHCGDHIIDTHDDHVIDEVWELYHQCFRKFGPRSTLVEWDAEIPAFEVVHAEALKAARYRALAGVSVE